MPRLLGLLLIALLLACAPATPTPPPPTATPTGVPAPSPASTLTPTPAPSPTARPPAATITPAPSPPPVVQIGVAQFVAEVAVTPEERQRGLSGHAPLPTGAGMLFVFDNPARYAFWMPGMLFPLDMVWIAADCRVVDITRDAPPQQPGQSLDDLPRYQPGQPALYVLEISAGEAARQGVSVGDTAAFTGALAGRFGC